MLSRKYRLRYLPLFYEDLDEKVTYILEKLKNPKAASGSPRKTTLNFLLFEPKSLRELATIKYINLPRQNI